MSGSWISHSNDSTGQAISLDNVVKIRTFKQVRDGRAIYRIVVEFGITNYPVTTWDFSTLTAATIAVDRIAEALKLDPHVLMDLKRGFE